MGVKWFHYLKGSERPDGVKKRALLDVVEPEMKTLIVCQEVNIRYFAKFTTYLDYARYVKKEVRDVNHCFYELIFGDLPQKPYFDCECLRKRSDGIALEEALKLEGVPLLNATVGDTSHASGKHELELTEEEADAAILTLIKCIQKVCPCIRDEDIFVFASHGPNKLSYHVIVDNWCFPNANENRAFHDKVMEIYPERYRGLVDHSMYKSIQQLRTYLSHKFQSERTKRLSKLSTWVPILPHTDDDHAFIQILGGSLVSNASYCKLLPSFKLAEKAKAVYNGVDVRLEAKDIDAIFELARTCGEEPRRSVSQLEEDVKVTTQKYQEASAAYKKTRKVYEKIKMDSNVASAHAKLGSSLVRESLSQKVALEEAKIAADLAFDKKVQAKTRLDMVIKALEDAKADALKTPEQRAAEALQKKDLYEGDFPFKLSDIKGSLVLLKRYTPSYCKMCDRVHENENPYLVVAGYNRDIYFYCRRADKGRRLYLGSLGTRCDETRCPLFGFADVEPLPGVQPAPLPGKAFVAPPLEMKRPVKILQPICTDGVPLLAGLEPEISTSIAEQTGDMLPLPKESPGLEVTVSVKHLPSKNQPPPTGLQIAMQLQSLPSTPRPKVKIDPVSIRINVLSNTQMKFHVPSRRPQTFSLSSPHYHRDDHRHLA